MTRHDRPAVSALLALLLLPLLAGCGGSAPEPATTPPPAEPAVATQATAPATGGSEPAAGLTTGWRYRFNMTSPPNERNAITERALYLYFWPDTSRVWFQLENRLGTPIKIVWNEFRFRSTDGEVFKVVHEGVPYQRRYEPLDYTLVPGLQRYSDWFAPVDLLEDPEAAQGGGMRRLFPTDASAQGFTGKSFGAEFVLEIEGVERRYPLSFRIDSVLPPAQ